MYITLRSMSSEQVLGTATHRMRQNVIEEKNDIASCVIKYLQEVYSNRPDYRHLILHSDTCGGQNRNRIISTAITLFLSAATNIHTVEQNFSKVGTPTWSVTPCIQP